MTNCWVISAALHYLVWMMCRILCAFFSLACTCGMTIAQPPPDATPVQGRVLQREGDPVAGAQVVLRRVSRPHQATALWGAQAATNEDGVFVFPQVEEGVYTLTVIAPDFAEYTSDLFEVQGTQSVDLPPFVLSPQPQVSGRIFDVRGRPVADTEFRVTLRWAYVANKRQQVRTTEEQLQTDSEGRYQLPLRGSGSGAFLVRALGKGWAASPLLKVEQEESTVGVDLSLRRGGDILILLLAQDTGAPLINATVSAQFRPTPATRLPFRPIFFGRTGNDGKCRFSEVPLGYWLVTAYPGDVPFGDAPAQMAYVGKEHTAGIMLAVSSGATVNVHVLGADAQVPVPGATVRLDNGETQVTGEDGVCTFSHVATGGRKVLVRAQGFATATQEFRVAGAAQPLRVSVVMHTAMGGVAGRVRDADGKPVPRAFVTAVALPPGVTFVPPAWAWSDEGWRERFVLQLDRYVDDAVAEADATGAFVIRGLAPGRYLLFAPMMHPPDAVSRPVVVPEGRVTEGVEVTVDAQCRHHISGRVLRPDGTPLRDALAQVSLRHSDGKYLVLSRFLLSTDEQGRYTFMRRGPGTYFIEVAVEGEGTAKLWRDVRDGEQVNNLDLRLRP